MHILSPIVVTSPFSGSAKRHQGVATAPPGTINLPEYCERPPMTWPIPTHHSPLSPATLAKQLASVLRGRPFAVLTGAGCSTESGIPDYRGPETRRRARNPIRFNEFIREPLARRRYWARAMVGYRNFANRQPNPGHYALSALQQEGHVHGLITQNVDDLHEQAGSTDVVALHGSLARVRCLDCGLLMPRADVQDQLRTLNPSFATLNAEQAPDGDAELDPAWLAHFRVVDCPNCGGPLKPHVVFFGENVPPERVQRAYDLCDAAEALLVVGSSLMVWSGYRFVRRTASHQKPLAILNVGESRGDALAQVRVEGLAGQVLPELYRELACSPANTPLRERSATNNNS